MLLCEPVSTVSLPLPQAVLIVLKETWTYNVNTTPGAEGGGKMPYFDELLRQWRKSFDQGFDQGCSSSSFAQFSHETRPENHLSANSWRILFVFLFYRNWNG